VTPSESTRTGRSEGAPNIAGNPELRDPDTSGTATVTGVTFGQKALQCFAADRRAIFEGDIELWSVEEVEAANAAMRERGFAEGVVIPCSQSRLVRSSSPRGD